MSANKLSIIDRLKHARRVSVPLVAINTADPQATIMSIGKAMNGGSPIVVYDAVRGVSALNQAGKDVAAKFADEVCCDGGSVIFLSKLASAAPMSTIAFFLNADHHINDHGAKFVIQGIWNLRDEFKQNARMLVLLGPSIILPPHLQNDIVVLDEELPDAAQLADIIREQHDTPMTCNVCKGNGDDKGIPCVPCNGTGRQHRPALAEDALNAAVEAALGLPAFTAEQAVAMSLRPGGKVGKGKDAVTLPTIDQDHLLSTKKSIVNQVAGLTVEDQNLTFDAVGGLDQIRKFTTKLFTGPYPPSLVVQIAEIEKAMSGTGGGDLSGTSDDQLGVLLENMENNGWGGLVAFGAPGTGKSLVTKAMANSFGRMSIVLDLGACKGSLVGESEAKVRAAVKTIKAIGGSNVFFVATANKLTIKPELLRRFRFGVWYFDLPSPEERAAIWTLQRKSWKINANDTQPNDADWTGSDIRNVCELAHKMGLPLQDALEFANSNAKCSPEAVQQARQAADGRYLSASKPGVYVLPQKSGQRMMVGE